MIYAIGDSYTYGAELESQHYAWPALLGQKLNKQIINQGRPATGNWRMIKRAMDAVFAGAEMIIVGWTDPLRKEFADDTGLFDVWAGRNYQNMQGGHRVDLVKYMTAYDVEEYHYTQWLRHIILLQQFCQANQTPCLMFISCGADSYNKLYIDNHLDLVEHINTETFLGWSNHSMQTMTFHLPRGPHGHCLNEGHELMAEKIDEYIRNLSWLS